MRAQEILPATVIALAIDESGPLWGLGFIGPPGCGKTTTALTLIAHCPFQRTRLVSDDGIVLEARRGRLLARAHPRTAGMAEIRPAGPIPLPHLADTVLQLVFDGTPPESDDRLQRLAPWHPLGDDGPGVPRYPLVPPGPLRLLAKAVLTGHLPPAGVESGADNGKDAQQ